MGELCRTCQRSARVLRGRTKPSTYTQWAAIAGELAPVARFDRAVRVFDPGKPGTSARIDAMQRDLAAGLPELAIELQPTGLAGHARDLARSVAAVGAPILVRVSDDEYHEVVSGVMDVPGSSAVSTVVPAGDANDHNRSTPSGC